MMKCRENKEDVAKSPNQGCSIYFELLSPYVNEHYFEGTQRFSD